MKKANATAGTNGAANIEIERGIPLPPLGRPAIYPTKQMEIGDSFFIVGRSAMAVRHAVHAAGTRYGRKFATRQVDGGVRVWRVA